MAYSIFKKRMQIYYIFLLWQTIIQTRQLPPEEDWIAPLSLILHEVYLAYPEEISLKSIGKS